MREPLVDGFGRVHRDLRISVTDRCNFRCTYCMPAEGMDWLPRSDVLTFEEIERIARVCVERFGVESIRLTGGEPTVRAHLPVLVGKVAALHVGGDGAPVDLSLTTNGATLRSVAGDLVGAGLRRVNISLDTLRHDRFVERMPLDAEEHWRSDAVVSQAEIVAAIDAVFPIEPLVRGHQPAERFAYRDGRGGGGG